MFHVKHLKSRPSAKQTVGSFIIHTIRHTNAGDNPKPSMGASCSSVIHGPSNVLAHGNNRKGGMINVSCQDGAKERYEKSYLTNSYYSA